MRAWNLPLPLFITLSNKYNLLIKQNKNTKNKQVSPYPHTTEKVMVGHIQVTCCVSRNPPSPQDKCLNFLQRPGFKSPWEIHFPSPSLIFPSLTMGMILLSTSQGGYCENSARSSHEGMLSRESRLMVNVPYWADLLSSTHQLVVWSNCPGPKERMAGSIVEVEWVTGRDVE